MTAPPHPLTLFVEQIAVLDSAVACPERGLYGTTLLVDLTLSGEETEPGMVVDFGGLKPLVRRQLEARLDHKLLVPRSSRAMRISEGPQTACSWRDADGRRYRHVAPADAYAFLDAPAVTPEALVADVERLLQAVWPAGEVRFTVDIRAEAIDGAAYHYCHGLKHHAGQCQRIAHGHRSRIEIRIDGARNAELEFGWAERWRDVYLGSRHDLVASDPERAHFRYEAADGAFELELPAARCELLDSETTVENIALYIAREVKRQHRDRTVEVRAYEGLNKGGLARL